MAAGRLRRQNLNSTVLFREDLIEICCAFGIPEYEQSQYSKGGFNITFITFILIACIHDDEICSAGEEKIEKKKKSSFPYKYLHIKQTHSRDPTTCIASNKVELLKGN